MSKIMKGDNWLYSYYDMMATEEKKDQKKMAKKPVPTKQLTTKSGIVLLPYSGSIDKMDLKNMTPEEYFKPELLVPKPDFGGKYDQTNLNHVKMLTEYYEAIDEVELKKQTTLKEFILQLPPKEVSIHPLPEKKIQEFLLDKYLDEMRNQESPEQVELKINKKLGKSELMGLKTQIKYATEEMTSMNAILNEYKNFLDIKERI